MGKSSNSTSQYFICQALAQTTKSKAQGRSDPPTHGPAAQTSQQPQGEPCIYKAGANAFGFNSRSFRKLHWLLKPPNGDLMNILKMPETQESKSRNQKDARSWNGKHWRTPFFSCWTFSFYHFCSSKPTHQTLERLRNSCSNFSWSLAKDWGYKLTSWWPNTTWKSKWWEKMSDK